MASRVVIIRAKPLRPKLPLDGADRIIAYWRRKTGYKQRRISAARRSRRIKLYNEGLKNSAIDCALSEAGIKPVFGAEIKRIVMNGSQLKAGLGYWKPSEAIGIFEKISKLVGENRAKEFLSELQNTEKTFVSRGASEPLGVPRTDFILDEKYLDDKIRAIFKQYGRKVSEIAPWREKTIEKLKTDTTKIIFKIVTKTALDSAKIRDRKIREKVYGIVFRYIEENSSTPKKMFENISRLIRDHKKMEDFEEIMIDGMQKLKPYFGLE